MVQVAERVKQICSFIDLLNNSVDDCLYIYDFKNDYYYVSPHAMIKYNMPSHKFYNAKKVHKEFVYSKDYPLLMNDFDELVHTNKSYHNMQYRWLDTNKNPIWINCKGYVVKEKGQSLYMLGCINEIGNKQKADYLTGLLNEFGLKDYLENEKQPRYILRLGIDDFKEVNEKLGIEYGDYVLKEISEIIYNCLTDQYVYKVRSDEFIILNFDENIDNIKSLYHYIKSAINKFVVKNHYEAIFTISGGIVEYTTYEEMMKYSEFALNEAKNQGKNRYYEFSKNDYDRFLRKKKITGYLSEAVSHALAGFDVFYQPLYSQDSQLYGAEALLRFHCEEYGNISPSEFIPILEETGLIIIVGKWVIYKATKTCKNIQEYIPEFKISINLSNKQLTHSNVVEDILRMSKKNHLDPKYIIVEFTESGIIETKDYYSNIWQKLKENDIKIALDDFGTGYSNFHYLNELKPDIVKIDYGFTHESILNNQKFKMLSLLCNMINTLNISICIEGIENKQEEDCMKKISYDYNQGYYYGKPCSYEDFLKNTVKV